VTQYSSNMVLGRQTLGRICALALVALIAVGCDLPGKPNPADRPKVPDQILSFAPLFGQNCAGCHGADGEFGPAPPLADALFLAIISDEELTKVVHDGRTGTPMPPFAQERGGELTDQQIKVLVDGLRSKWGEGAKAGQSLPAYALTKVEGVQSAPGSRERGNDVFARACAGCHGSLGKGVVHEGEIHDTINDPAFLALISDQALRRIIITGRPDLGMPTYAEKDGRPKDFQPLTAAEIDDLVALLADWRATGNVSGRMAAKP
jgi:mono/diheme cytochrome c family protein